MQQGQRFRRLGPYDGLSMTSITVPTEHTLPADWRDFVALTKPRVMSLVVFTGAVGLIASRAPVHPVIALTIILCVALGAGAAAALNQWYEADIDALMKRTRNRPLPDGRMEPQSALHFGVGLAAFSVLLLGFATNWLAASILLASILFYVVIYTVWLKRRTPQNIVIGGAAGAFPPVIGWVAATGHVDVLPLLLFALTFLWTPPHFWALALYVETDYAAAGVPMLPVVAGERSTRTQIMFYTLLMSVVALLPVTLNYAGWIYGTVALVMTGAFALLALKVGFRTQSTDDGMKPERRLFFFSILYLFVIFGALALDRVLA